MNLLFLFSLFTFVALDLASSIEYFRTVSGKDIPVHAVRSHFPTVHTGVLPHAIFELNLDSSIRNHFKSFNIADLAPNLEKIQVSHEVHTTIRFGNSHTFAFHGRTGALIAAWGPGIQLHPLDSSRYPNVYVNSLALQGLELNENTSTQLKTSMKSTAGPLKSCVILNELKIQTFLTNRFCEMFNNDSDTCVQVVTALYHRVSRLFMSTSCTIINARVINNERNTTFQYPNPEGMSKCATEKGCIPSSFILKNFIYSEDEYLEILVLFTGYGVPNSTLAGAAYRSTPCASAGRYIWTVRHDDVVLAHELGHLLGAEHDQQGIMRHTLDYNSPLLFSEKSIAVIRRFVFRDKRSSCLRFFSDLRDHTKFSYSRNHYFTQAFVGNSGVITVFQIKGANMSDSLHYYSYDAFESCRPGNSPGIPIQNSSIMSGDLHILPLGFKGSVLIKPISVTFGSSSSLLSSPLMFVAYSVRLPSYKHQIVYRVGYGFDPSSGDPPSRWGPQLRFPINEDLNSNFAIAIGQILGSKTNDMVVMYEKYDKGMFYIFGSNLGSSADVSHAWSPPIFVPNRFPLHKYSDFTLRGIRLSVTDVDGNGRPELIVFYQLEQIYSSKMQTFIRMGMNLDRRGHVTGGWTDMKQMDADSVAVGYALNCPKPFFTSSYIPPVRNNESNPVIFRLHLNISEPSFAKGLSETVLSHAPMNDSSQGCAECFVGQKLEQCKKRLKVCAASIDEVYYNTYEESLEENEAGMNNIPSNSSLMKSIRFTRRAPRSLFCIGFNYFRRKRDTFCDVVDRERVISKGAELAFWKALETIKFKKPHLLHSYTLFADPFGVNGNNQQIVAQFTIAGKKQRFAKVLKRAFIRLHRQSEFNTFGQDSLILKRFYRNGKWYIQIETNSAHILEA